MNGSLQTLVPTLALVLAALGVSGCQSADQPAETGGLVATEPPPAAPQPVNDELPAAVLDALRSDFFSADMETRYFDASVDLNGDGRPERIVHLIGPMACGTGGCPTLVFTPEGEGYRLVTSISVSRPPIRATTETTEGWRNLIVTVGGGGGTAGNALLAFDGTSYPSNPTVAPATRVTDEVAAAAEILIAEFGSFQEATLLTAAGTSGAGS